MKQRGYGQIVEFDSHLLDYSCDSETLGKLERYASPNAARWLSEDFGKFRTHGWDKVYVLRRHRVFPVPAFSSIYRHFFGLV